MTRQPRRHARPSIALDETRRQIDRQQQARKDLEVTRSEWVAAPRSILLRKQRTPFRRVWDTVTTFRNWI